MGADPLEATIANRKSTAQQTLKVRKSKRLRRAQLAVISTNRLSGAFRSREGSRQTTPSGSRLTTPSGGSTRNSGASEGLSARNLLGKAAAAGDSVPLPPLPTIQGSFSPDHRSLIDSSDKAAMRAPSGGCTVGSIATDVLAGEIGLGVQISYSFCAVHAWVCDI